MSLILIVVGPQVEAAKDDQQEAKGDAAAEAADAAKVQPNENEPKTSS